VRIKLMPTMSLAPSAYHQLTPDLKICRLLNGMWQVSGSHGTIVPQRAIAAMLKYHQAGFTTWDLADHYGPAEDFIGAFRRKRITHSDRPVKKSATPSPLPQTQALTKWVPQPGNMSRIIVEEKINLSLRRMGGDYLDLLQFHWWDYADDRYLDALKHLADLQAVGKIKHLGLTNFDTTHLQRVIDAGIPIVSNQVQFSLVDQRPLVKMTDFCAANGIQLLAYGTLCGSLIAEKYQGQPNPNRYQLNTASLRKYKNMIEAWGGWDLFQVLLKTLSEIAAKHQVSLSNVAVRYILDQPMVAGAIVGARLSVSEHLEDNARIFGLTLDQADREALFAVLDRSNDLFQYFGDCGAEYRN
jgi:aryl-alcohol dehydrogenase-like predicted oxidoreductase